ncbi:kazal-type proteinase inhibitor [Plakobranchus ocellatus]|uniref:Kazal-type proteinase inhibitor n=1 Tax=Plakobranchus ocellatus TaxID=259542 RepID=A0AAV4DX03_9GAST|nr:kazal-type proteinase inhibitor [Plakobranchus ocellatus]
MGAKKRERTDGSTDDVTQAVSLITGCIVLQFSAHPKLPTAMFISSALALVIYCCVGLSQGCDPEEHTACPAIHAPVCATLHKTFSNPCVMESELCRLAKDGFHFVEHRDGDCCVGPMPYIYSPTCASDGHTYSNWWDMNYSACSARDYLTEAPPETCDDFPHNDTLRPVS